MFYGAIRLMPFVEAKLHPVHHTPTKQPGTAPKADPPLPPHSIHGLILYNKSYFSFELSFYIFLLLLNIKRTKEKRKCNQYKFCARKEYKN